MLHSNGILLTESTDIFTPTWRRVLVIASDKTKVLYIGKVTRRFLTSEKGPSSNLKLAELLPKNRVDGELKASPPGKKSVGIYVLHDIIAGPLDLEPTKEGYTMAAYAQLVKFFVSKLPRKDY